MIDDIDNACSGLKEFVQEAPRYNELWCQQASHHRIYDKFYGQIDINHTIDNDVYNDS